MIKRITMNTKKYVAAFAIALLAGFTTVQAQSDEYELILEADFESGIPVGWKESSFSNVSKWQYTTGNTNYPQSPTYAPSGEKNATFYYETPTYFSTLYTSIIDLSEKSKPVLSFYLCIPDFLNDPFEFEIRYRSSEDDANWITLRKFEAAIDDWELQEIVLPSQVMQIGFYAKATSSGNGVCIDQVRVENRVKKPRSIGRVNMWNIESSLPAGSKENPIAGTKLTVDGNNKTLTLNTLNYVYEGTAASDIEKYSIYYTMDSLFSPTERLGEVTGGNSTFTFSGINKSLVTGKNFIWLCADISSSAAHGNGVSVGIPAAGVTSTPQGQAATTQPALAIGHTTSGSIEESLVVYGFEEANATTNWQLYGPNWQIGIPQGTGTGDPSSPYAGTHILATNLNGNYTNTSTNDSVVSPTANALYYKDVKLHLARVLNIPYFDKTAISIKELGDTLWTNSNDEIKDSRWTRYTYSVSNATRKEAISMKVGFQPNKTNTPLGGWNIDNFAITGDYIAHDAGIESVAPVDKCGLTLQPTTLKVVVRNYGGENITSPFEVGYSLDNGRTYTKKSCSSQLKSKRLTNNAAETMVEFEFDPVLLTAGLKQLVFKTFLNGDEDDSNDAILQKLYVFPTVSEEYAESFEKNNGYWYATGTNSTWAYGTPAGTSLNAASDGTKAWATKLSGNYSNNETSYLESPCFDLTNIPFPVFSFEYKMLVADANDILKVEYSLDGGTTWGDLAASSNYQQNWSASGWNATTADFVTAYTLLPEADFGKSGVKFRFKFTSNADGVNEGVVIDNIKLAPLAYNVSLTNANFAPQSSCQIGDTKISFTFKNLGHRTVVSGTKIPFTVKIDNKAEIKDTITVDANINTNGAKVLQTSKFYTIATAGEHKIVIANQLSPNFDITTDDTLKTNVEITGMPFYTLGADIGTTTISTITLDAGEASAGVDYTSYLWQYTENLTSPSWANEDTTRKISPPTKYGYYAVTVTNAGGCSATDTIKIIDSNQDVKVESINNIASACNHNETFSPTVTLKHNAGNTFDGIVGFEVGLSINGTEVLSETHTPANGWAANGTTNFTFSGTIDLSQPQNYDIRAYTKFANDVNKTNDTAKVEIATWGLPGLEFTYPDTFPTTSASVLSLLATCTSNAAYTWEHKYDGETAWTQETETSLTLSLTSNLSAYYRITATDNVNSCGSSKDSVYINTKDIGISAITTPSDTLCYNEEGINIVATIKNYGADTYAAGTQFKASMTSILGAQVQTVTLDSPLGASATINVTFPQKLNLELQENTITASVEADNDVNSLNDSYTKHSYVVERPSVDIALDTLFQAFGETTTYTITPTYSGNCRTYLWNYTDANSQNNNSTFKILGFPEKKYVVTASNGFCSAKDSLIVMSTDIALTEITTPYDTCSFEAQEYPIRVKVKNLGSDLPTGAKIRITGTATIKQLLQADQNINIDETINLSKFKSQKDTTVTLSNKLNLKTKNAVSIALHSTADGFDDLRNDNDIVEKNVFAMGYPSVSFKDIASSTTQIEVLTASKTLSLSEEFAFYDWTLPDTTSTNSTITFSRSGSYSVTATNFSGCAGKKSINVNFIKNDLTVDSLLAPQSNCLLGSTESLKIRVKNIGEYTIPKDSTITIAHKINTNEIQTESYTLTNALAPNESIDITFTNPINLSTPNNYTIATWVKAANDRTTNNDTLTTTVTHYAPVVISNFLDKTICQDDTATLKVTGNGIDNASTYLWSTGSTTDTSFATTAGKYWVRVINGNGCSQSDTLEIKVNALPIVSLEPSISLCSGDSTQLLADNASTYLWNNGSTSQSIWVKQAGIYSVKITDNNGCSNSGSSTLVVNALPTISLGEDHSICSNTTAVLDAGQAATYAWSNGQSTQTISVSTANTYWAQITDANGCVNSDTIKIAVKGSPTVDLGNDRQICTGKTETLIPTTTGTGLSYLWSNSQTSSSITITKNGSYSVTVTNANNCQDSDTINITYYTPVDVNIVSSCNGNSSITLDAGSGTYTYLWNTGQTSQTIEASPSQTYNVTITDLNSCQYRDTVTATLPEVNLGNDISICEGTPTTLYNLYNTSYSNHWSTGASTSSIEITTAGTYWLQVGNTTDGCFNTDTIIVSAVATPQTTLPGDTSVCIGTSISLNAGVNANSYHWSNGATTARTSYTITGNTEIWIDVAGSNGCVNRDKVTVTALALPNVNLGDDAYVNSNTTLDAGSGFTSYRWQDGSTNQTLTVTQDGSYSVTVTDANGCANSDTVTIKFSISIDLIISQLISPNEECSAKLQYPVKVVIKNRGTKTYSANEQITINTKVNSGSYTSENITLTSALAQNATFEHTLNNNVSLDAGDHELTFYMKYNDTSCETSKFEATVHQSPTLHFNADTIKAELPYSFNPNINGTYTYQWSNGSTGSTLNITQYGQYWLIITDANGCTASDTIRIISTSIGEITDVNAQIVAYPNPARHNLNIGIKSDAQNSYSIKIIAPNGIEVWQKNTPLTSAHTETINVENFAPGVYFVRVDAQGHSAILKVVITQ